MPITQTHPYHHLKDRIEQGSRRQIRHLPEFLWPHHCWSALPTTFLWWNQTRDWYASSLRRSQRNVGAVVALEIALEASAMFASTEPESRFVEHVQQYAAMMREAASGRPGRATRVHQDWLRRRLDDRSAPPIPDGRAHQFVNRLDQVFRGVHGFFLDHGGVGYKAGWSAVSRASWLALHADLVDTEHQAFALWWHTLRCRIAFCDSATCTVV